MDSLKITMPQQCCNFTSVCHFSSALVQGVVPARTLRPPKILTTFGACSSNYLGATLPHISLKLSTCASGYHKPTTICYSGGEGKSQSDDQGSPFKVFQKDIKFFRKESVEDLLRKQIQTQEYYDGGSGGSGGSDPGGSGGGGSDGSGGSGNESLWDEVAQVILATIGFVFLYMLIIEGEEITTFARDIIKFLFTGRKSIRLRRLIDDWVKGFQSMMETKKEDPYALEKAIINTPTWWDSPAKYKLLYRRYLASKSEE